MIRKTVTFRGNVQGVGFRWTTIHTARGFAVTGTVRNCPDGSVELVAEGDAGQVEAFVDAVAERMTGYVSTREQRRGQATGEFRGFGVAR